MTGQTDAPSAPTQLAELLTIAGEIDRLRQRTDATVRQAEQRLTAVERRLRTQPNVDCGPCRAWRATATYDPDDLCHSAGTLYRARRANRDQRPPNGAVWTPLRDILRGDQRTK